MPSPVHPRASEPSSDTQPTRSRRVGASGASVMRSPTVRGTVALPPHLLVVDTLGEGGTATVYEAFHQRLKVKVAVKVPKPSSMDAPELHMRLVREAELCARLGGSRVPHIYDVDNTADGTPYVVMDLIRGRSVEALLQHGPLEVDMACTILCDLLSAVGELHAAGIVHRDIKPSNLMLEDSADGSLRVRILDLGIAACLPAARFGPETRLTQSGMFVGTPGYMAHEQLLGKEVDHRADIYAVGTVFYEMLAGEAAFAGQSAGQVIAAALRDDAKPLHHLPQALTQIVRRAMAKSADDRYGSAQAMRLAIQHFQAQALAEHSDPDALAAAQALPSCPPYTQGKLRRYRRLSWLVAALGMVATVTITWPGRPKTAPTSPAAGLEQSTVGAAEKPLTEPPRLLLEAPPLMADETYVEDHERPSEETSTRQARARLRALRRESTSSVSVDEREGSTRVYDPFRDGPAPSSRRTAPLPANSYSEQ